MCRLMILNFDIRVAGGKLNQTCQTTHNVVVVVVVLTTRYVESSHLGLNFFSLWPSKFQICMRLLYIHIYGCSGAECITILISNSFYVIFRTTPIPLPLPPLCLPYSIGQPIYRIAPTERNMTI